MLDADRSQGRGVVRLLGIEADGLLERGGGLVQPVAMVEHLAQIEMAEGRVRGERHGLLGLALGFREAPLLQQAEGEERVGVGVLMILGELAAQLFLGQIVAALLEEEPLADEWTPWPPESEGGGERYAYL